MARRALTGVAIGLALSSVSVVAAQVHTLYKWMNADGVAVFSETLPEGVSDYEVIEMETPPEEAPDAAARERSLERQQRWLDVSRELERSRLEREKAAAEQRREDEPPVVVVPVAPPPVYVYPGFRPRPHPPRHPGPRPEPEPEPERPPGNAFHPPPKQ